MPSFPTQQPGAVLQVRAPMRGVTLIETLTVISVIAIITAIGFPSMHAAIASSRATTVANRLLTDLSRARSEAVMRSGVAVVCPSADGSSCASGANWSDGWIVFADANADNQRNAAEAVLSAMGAGDLNGLRVATTSGRSLVRFRSDGRNGGSNLTINLCDGEVLSRQVIVNVGGRGRVERLNAAGPSPVCH